MSCQRVLSRKLCSHAATQTSNMYCTAGPHLLLSLLSAAVSDSAGVLSCPQVLYLNKDKASDAAAFLPAGFDLLGQLNRCRKQPWQCIQDPVGPQALLHVLLLLFVAVCETTGVSAFPKCSTGPSTKPQKQLLPFLQGLTS